METREFKKTLLLKLYIEALIKTPFIYKWDYDNYRGHRNTLYTLITLLINNPYEVNVFEGTRKKDEKEYLETNIRLYEAYKEYNEFIKGIDISEIDKDISKISDYINNFKIDTEDISYEEMLYLTYEFYNSIPDKEINQIFNKLYKERHNNIRINKESYSTLLPSVNYYLITLDEATQSRKELIYDLIHEYGHCIQTTLTGKIDFYGEEYKPVELMPVFFNMLSTFYFDNEKTTQELEHMFLLNQLSAFTNQIRYTEEIMSNGLDAFKENHSEGIIKRYFKINLLQIYSYFIPQLTSIELLTKYKENPEKTIYILKELVKGKNNTTFLEDLTNNDIVLGSHTDEMIKTLKK